MIHLNMMGWVELLVASSVLSGWAIQHVKDNIFTEEGGVRKGVPKVLLVLTDGRSQDDVNKVSKEMQREGQSSGFLLDVSGLWRREFEFPLASDLCNVSVDNISSGQTDRRFTLTPAVGCYFLVSPTLKATSCSPSVSPMLITASW